MTSQPRNPRIALVGCGAIAEIYYLPAIAKHPSVLDELVLVDTNEDRLKALAKQFHVRNWACDYREVLGKVDGAIVALPHQLHYQISMDFLGHGVHVLCEKPLASSITESNEMVAQADQFGVTLSVNNTRRLFPAYSKIKQLISENTLGKLISIKYVDGEIFNWPTASGFYFKNTAHRGVLFDRGVHGLDTVCWWLGGKPKVISSENDSFGGVEGAALVKLEYNGCMIESKLSWLNKLQNIYTIVGELGTIEGGIEGWASVSISYKSGRTERIKLNSNETQYSDFGKIITANFIDIISKGAPPLIPAREVTSSIELIEECYKVATRFKMPWYDNLRFLVRQNG